MIRKYAVCISQINQQVIVVEATDADEAIIKAGKKWKKENQPHINYVEYAEKLSPSRSAGLVPDMPQKAYPKAAQKGLT